MTSAAVGDTVTVHVLRAEHEHRSRWCSCGFVDDQLGIVAEAEAVVEPAATLCNTDLGPAITHVVDASEAGGPLRNEATVTVQTQESVRREFQATADAVVQCWGNGPQ